ncbi:ABC transporter substrate-binding protein [Alpinimonas psychrophila]|uniref:Polar amino acid transport system substrate-binding protein n=1 Tax=Alpinimonas psychrophila TaxID=748908 RepID=A0A7W3JRR7_9MICO|nr:ABC transporter substrate-binding protein [Alpinimonas psychrophila]MBA8828039.1 polar amino acid transport system substrate-binding protein [Alpinimonas psychrophila]
MRKRLVIPALVAITVLALTGCVNNATTTGAATTAAAIGVDSAAVALLPADIAKSGVLSIGIDATYPPNEFKDANGNPIGWDVEIANGVAAKLGLKPEYQVAQFANIIPSVVGNKVNIGVSSFTDTVEREAQVDFVNYYEAGIMWASAAGKTVDPNNACGLKVAVQATTYEDTDEVPAKSAACVAAGKAPIEKTQFDTQDAATNAVALGQVDALSADSPVTMAAIANTNGKLQAAGVSFDVAPYGIAVSKTGGLGKAIQAALQSMIDDGSYMAILDNWGVGDGAIKTITINAAAKG